MVRTTVGHNIAINEFRVEDTLGWGFGELGLGLKLGLGVGVGT